MMNVTIAR